MGRTAVRPQCLYKGAPLIWTIQKSYMRKQCVYTWNQSSTYYAYTGIQPPLSALHILPDGAQSMVLPLRHRFALNTVTAPPGGCSDGHHVPLRGPTEPCAPQNPSKPPQPNRGLGGDWLPKGSLNNFLLVSEIRSRTVQPVAPSLYRLSYDYHIVVTTTESASESGDF